MCFGVRKCILLKYASEGQIGECRLVWMSTSREENRPPYLCLRLSVSLFLLLSFSKHVICSPAALLFLLTALLFDLRPHNDLLWASSFPVIFCFVLFSSSHFVWDLCCLYACACCLTCSILSFLEKKCTCEA